MTREGREKAIKYFKMRLAEKTHPPTTAQQKAFTIALEALQEPEIVHCKDCKYWIGTEDIKQCSLAGYLIGERGYCLYACVR